MIVEIELLKQNNKFGNKLAAFQSLKWDKMVVILYITAFATKDHKLQRK